MKVTLKSDQKAVGYCKIPIGSYFLHDGMAYVKVSYVKNVAISNGEVRYFNEGDYCFKLQGEFKDVSPYCFFGSLKGGECFYLNTSDYLMKLNNPNPNPNIPNALCLKTRELSFVSDRAIVRPVLKEFVEKCGSSMEDEKCDFVEEETVCFMHLEMGDYFKPSSLDTDILKKTYKDVKYFSQYDTRIVGGISLSTKAFIYIYPYDSVIKCKKV